MANQEIIDQMRAIGDFVTDISLIIRNKRKRNALKVLHEYLRVKLKQIFWNGKTGESFLGFNYYFFNYSQFVSLLSHSQIRDQYFFTTDLSNPFIIDCGANIGDSVVYFKELFPRSKILAFEPDPPTFDKLTQTTKANNFTEVVLQNKAVGAKIGTAKFYFDSENPGLATMSLFKERMNKQHKDIMMVKLSNYISSKVHMLKIDTEGTEGGIIADLIHSQKIRFVEKMIIEYHHHIGGKSNSLALILRNLETNGFEFQLSTELRPPFVEDIFQDILIYAYRH